MEGGGVRWVFADVGGCGGGSGVMEGKNVGLGKWVWPVC